VAPDRHVRGGRHPRSTGPPRLDLDAVVAAVAGHDPDLDDDHRTDAMSAATALVLAADGRGGADVLFIERVSRPGDRWSGQMALPGGKREPGDPDLATTALRETAEEVGVTLPPAVGRLDDLRPPSGRRGHVATFVHVVEERPPTVPEPSEVASVVWIELAHLFDPANTTRHFHGGLGPFAGIAKGRHTVWGLTLGTLRNFASVIGHELPRPRGPLLG
jgi:8-oxo-dGTP pyrophosphatase MutT (NUDIX family)